MLVLLSAAAAVTLRAEDWPEFRGPTGQGHSTERNIPFEWSESRNVLWKTPVPGIGWSSPAVANGRVWLTTAVKDRNGGSLRAIAYDIATGREAINTEVFHVRSVDPLNPKNSLADPTPILDGDRVYVHFGADGTAALTMSGDVIWKTHFDYESQHGDGGSLPLRRPPDHQLRWRRRGVRGCRRRPPARFGGRRASPAMHRPIPPAGGSRRQSGRTDLRGRVPHDRLSDDRPGDLARQLPCELSGRLLECHAPRIRRGPAVHFWRVQYPVVPCRSAGWHRRRHQTHIAWTLTRGAPLTPSPLVIDGDLYIVNDTGIAVCLDARTGQMHWQHRLNGTYSASPVFADGRIYFLSEEGLATVIAPGHEFRELASNTLSGDTLASIAVSNGSIFIRSASHLYRIGAKAS
jgi:outer membrane protein assembly factor BamB